MTTTEPLDAARIAACIALGVSADSRQLRLRAAHRMADAVERTAAEVATIEAENLGRDER